MKKLFLGLALGVAALGTTLSLGKVNAAADGYKQDFNYNAEYATGITAGSNTYNIDQISAHATVTSAQDQDGTEYVRYHLDAGTTNQPTYDPAGYGAQSMRMTAAGYNQPDAKGTVVKMRFRVSNTHRHTINMYGSSYSTKILSFQAGNSGATYSVGGSNNTSTGGIDETNLNTFINTFTITPNAWMELTTILVNNGDNTEGQKDMVYTYLNDVLIYQVEVATGRNWNGQISNFTFQSDTSNNRPEDNWDIDYLYIENYNGATASVNTTYETNVGSSVVIEPTLTATDTTKDPSMSAYNVVIADDTKLAYHEDTKRFEGLAEGSTTVTFNFVDPLIQPVTTTVNVGAAPSEILVESMSLNYFENNTIDLVVGESYDLDDLLTVNPSSATNPALEYVAGSDPSYSLSGSTVTATKVGSSKLTVNSADSGNATLELTINVVAGYLANLPAVGTQYTDMNQTHYAEGSTDDHNTYVSLGSGSKTFSPIEIVNGDFGKTVQISGVGGSNAGASYLNHHVYGSNLEENANYKVVVIARVNGTLQGGPRLDLILDGFYETENEEGQVGVAYDTVNFRGQIQHNASSLNNGYVIAESGVVNYDSTRLDGLKIQLTAWNTCAGITYEITHIKLVKVEGETEYKGVEVTNGENTLPNVTTDVPSVTLTEAGAITNIVVSAIPSTAALGDVVYTSSDTSVATVANGVVTAVANGTTRITVEVKGGTYYLDVVVNIDNPITSMTVENTTVEIDVTNVAYNMAITINPSDYTTEITYDIADKTVVSNASVINGLLYITPAAAGSTTVTLKAGEVELVINVTVVDSSTSEPGDEPGTDEPGTDEPGTDEPGTDEPGTDEPGTDEPDPEPTPEEPEEGNSNTGAIVGGVIGGVVVLGAAAGIAYYLIKKRKK